MKRRLEMGLPLARPSPPEQPEGGIPASCPCLPVSWFPCLGGFASPLSTSGADHTGARRRRTGTLPASCGRQSLGQRRSTRHLGVGCFRSAVRGIVLKDGGPAERIGAVDENSGEIIYVAGGTPHQNDGQPGGPSNNWQRIREYPGHQRILPPMAAPLPRPFTLRSPSNPHPPLPRITPESHFAVSSAMTL